MSGEQVVVSAGEPVAWEVEDCGGKRVRVLDCASDLEGLDASAVVAPLFASAPVVLPETPPADLIEQMAEAIGPGDAQMLREAAVSAYEYVRAWVAGGGETR